ncbi:MAG: hypothetical protein EBY83_06910, partial [Verrucomicrobia bacterium]|nr:hypothetical protein [Verrucomicrobiota bacterium]
AEARAAEEMKKVTGGLELPPGITPSMLIEAVRLPDARSPALMPTPENFRLRIVPAATLVVVTAMAKLPPSLTLVGACRVKVGGVGGCGGDL